MIADKAQHCKLGTDHGGYCMYIYTYISHVYIHIYTYVELTMGTSSHTVYNKDICDRPPCHRRTES